MPGFRYRDRYSRYLGIYNKLLKKITYSHERDLNTYNLGDRIQCPVQPDQNKHAELYRAGLRRLSEARRTIMKLKLIPEQQNVFDYFAGRVFYLIIRILNKIF